MTAAPMPIPYRPAAPKRPARPRLLSANMPVARLGLIVNLLVPLALLAWDARKHTLGVDAVNFAIHTTGQIAVAWLLVSLAVTPLRNLTGFAWVVQFRRAVGCYAFYYAAAHLAIYFWWDRQRNLHSTVSEIVHRRYLTIGFASLALMAPLWATSFNAAIRWMGGKQWKLLHRLAYVAAGLACYHYYLQSKADHRKPDVAIGVLAGLLLWRAVAAVVHLVRAPAKAAPAAPGAKARSWKGELKVIGMFRETPAVRTFRLAPADGGPVPFAFKAGQFLNLGLDVDGKRVSRSYTIASPPTRDNYVELTVKREDHGHVSQYLHDMLMTGQAVAVSAPAGRFTFDPATSPAGVTLVAGGVGITPVMAILRDLTDRCWAAPVDLVFSVRGPADVVFEGELHLLAARFPNVHVHVTVTGDAPPDWAGPRGRVTADLLGRLVPNLPDRAAFVCGPDAMAQAVRDELVAAGVPAERVTLESFSPAAATPAAGEPAGTATATVTFSTSGKSAPLPDNRTVLDVAEACGVQIDYQCRSGICGTCRVKLLDGRVTMPVRDALTDADEKDGYVLACQAHAAEDITVDA